MTTVKDRTVSHTEESAKQLISTTGTDRGSQELKKGNTAQLTRYNSHTKRANSVNSNYELSIFYFASDKHRGRTSRVEPWIMVVWNVILEAISSSGQVGEPWAGVGRKDSKWHGEYI